MQIRNRTNQISTKSIWFPLTMLLNQDQCTQNNTNILKVDINEKQLHVGIKKSNYWILMGKGIALIVLINVNSQWEQPLMFASSL